jgi:hypothetical protein
MSTMFMAQVTSAFDCMTVTEYAAIPAWDFAVAS